MLFTNTNTRYHDWVTEALQLPSSIQVAFVAMHIVSLCCSLLSLFLAIFLIYYHFVHSKNGLFMKSKAMPGIYKPMPMEALILFLTGFSFLDLLWHTSLLYQWGGFLQNTLFFHFRYIVGYIGLVLFHAGIMYTIPNTILATTTSSSILPLSKKKNGKVNPFWMKLYVISFSLFSIFGIGSLALLHGLFTDVYGLHIALWLSWTFLVIFFSIMIFAFGQRLILTMKETIAFQKQTLLVRHTTTTITTTQSGISSTSSHPSLDSSQNETNTKKSTRLINSMQQREFRLKILQITLKQLQITFTLLPVAALCFGLVNCINLVLWDVTDVAYFFPSALHIMSGPITTFLVFVALAFKASANITIGKLLKRLTLKPTSTLKEMPESKSKEIHAI